MRRSIAAPLPVSGIAFGAVKRSSAAALQLLRRRHHMALGAARIRKRHGGVERRDSGHIISCGSGICAGARRQVSERMSAGMKQTINNEDRRAASDIKRQAAK